MSFTDRAETLLVRCIVGVFRALPPEAASNLGGAILRTFGPLMPSNRAVVNNLARALPGRASEHREIGRGAWENLGRVLAELVHLPAILQPTSSGPGLEVVNPEIIATTNQSAGPAVYFSAHLSNWEILIPAGIRLGGRIAGIYRAPQRPGVNALLTALRRAAAGADFPLYPKGAKGGRDAFAFMRGGGKLAVLMDQKLNEGIAAPFFGHDAMTATAAAKFALHFRCPVVPVHIERIGPARYRMVAEQALELPASGDADADLVRLTARVNEVIEGWIRARPGEWLWMHRRWPE